MPQQPKYVGLVADTMQDYNVTIFASEGDLEKRMCRIMRDAGFETTDPMNLEAEWQAFTNQAELKTGDRYHRFGFDYLPTEKHPVECN